MFWKFRVWLNRNWTGQQVQRGGRGADLAGSNPQIFGSGGQATMAEQELNGSHVGAGFEQMDGESVALIPLTELQTLY
jgi:hypothetical protein